MLPFRTCSLGDWEPEGKKERCSEEGQVLVKQVSRLLAVLPITEERLTMGISQFGDVFCKGSSPVGNFPLTTISFTCSVSSPYTGRIKFKKKN